MSGTPAAASGASSNKPPVFLGQPNAGLFTVVSATKEISKQVTPKITVHTYRVMLQVDKSLPAIADKTFEMKVEAGEGTGSEQLGLVEWIPLEPGQKCALGFDAERMGNAKRTISLSAGSSPEQTWTDTDRYYNCLKDGESLDAGRVADAIAKTPRPQAAFFQLVFQYDRTALSSAKSVRAVAGYLSDAKLPPLERRKVIAHFMPVPDDPTSGAGAELAESILKLALDLEAAKEADSAGVLFNRLDSFFKDGQSGDYRFKPPALDSKQRDTLIKLSALPTAGVNAAVQRDFKLWLTQ